MTAHTRVLIVTSLYDKGAGNHRLPAACGIRPPKCVEPEVCSTEPWTLRGGNHFGVWQTEKLQPSGSSPAPTIPGTWFLTSGIVGGDVSGSDETLRPRSDQAPPPICRRAGLQEQERALLSRCVSSSAVGGAVAWHAGWPAPTLRDLHLGLRGTFLSGATGKGLSCCRQLLLCVETTCWFCLIRGSWDWNPARVSHRAVSAQCSVPETHQSAKCLSFLFCC